MIAWKIFHRSTTLGFKRTSREYNMQFRWVDEFCNFAESNGVSIKSKIRVRGWIETLLIDKERYFTKSISYNQDPQLYFSGVDPAKLHDTGNSVLICGGKDKELRDIFIIPWNFFFDTLRKGEPLNTYRPPKEYWQYKFKLKYRGQLWKMYVQGGETPILEVNDWRFAPKEAVAFLLKKSKS